MKIKINGLEWKVEVSVEEDVPLSWYVYGRPTGKDGPLDAEGAGETYSEAMDAFVRDATSTGVPRPRVKVTK